MAVQQPEKWILHPPRKHARNLLVAMRITPERRKAKKTRFSIVRFRLLRDDASIPILEEGLHFGTHRMEIG